MNNLALQRGILIFAAATIFALGLLMVFSTSSAEVLDHALKKNTHQAFFKQIFYALGGGLLSYIAYRIGYDKLLKASPQILLFLSFMLLLVLIPGIGKQVNGSKRWLNLFGFSFQPSEFVKYFLPAFFILKAVDREMTFLEFLKLIALIAIPMGLILVEPNNGTTAVIGVTLLIVFLLMSIPFKFWGVPLITALVIGGIFASSLPYVSGRINAYMHPELDLKGKGHQPYQAKIAAGSGGLWGRGPGNSLQKLSYLPEAQNDYIAAIFAEEWGFVGIVLLISLYMLIAYTGFSLAIASTSKTGLFFGGAITFLITFQAFLNMGVVSGLLPSTGLNLPLFSQGGSSLMANMMGLGILLSIGEK